MFLAQLTEATNAVKSFDSVQNPWTVVVGLFVVAAIAFGLASWRVCSVVYKDFMIPGRDRMFNHLDTVDDTMRSLDTSNKLIADRLTNVEGKLDSVSGQVKSVSERVEHIERNVIVSGRGVMVFAMLFLSLGCSEAYAKCELQTKDLNDYCEVIELNHFHDYAGHHNYDQYIFWTFVESDNEYHVRAWAIVDQKDTPRVYDAGRFVRIHYYDHIHTANRTITARYFRESWTQNDPERDDKKSLDESLRVALTKRTVREIQIVEAE
jgi:hypothetical protein